MTGEQAAPGAELATPGGELAAPGGELATPGGELAAPAGELAERNRELIAARLRWPDGALDACRRFEADHPDWRACYDRGGTTRQPDPGYLAFTRRNRHGDPVVYAPDTSTLAAKVAQINLGPSW